MTLFTKHQLQKMVPLAPRRKIELFYNPLLKACEEYDINTPLRIAHFIGQLVHESGSFRYMEEIASGRAYEGRRDLGNVKRGDGVRFKGRGLIQLTGRYNYQRFTNEMKIDIMTDPTIVATDPELCVAVAAWYWRGRKLNIYADKDSIRQVTRRINGGYNGLRDRTRWVRNAKKVLNV